MITLSWRTEGSACPSFRYTTLIRRQVSIYSLLVPYIATLLRRCSSHMSVHTIERNPADDKISPQLAPRPGS